MTGEAWLATRPMMPALWPREGDSGTSPHRVLVLMHFATRCIFFDLIDLSTTRRWRSLRGSGGNVSSSRRPLSHAKAPLQ